MTCKEAGRPLPVFSEDEVIDYLVAEALVMKMGHKRQEKEEQDKREAWRKDRKALANRAGTV